MESSCWIGENNPSGFIERDKDKHKLILWEKELRSVSLDPVDVCEVLRN